MKKVMYISVLLGTLLGVLFIAGCGNESGEEGETSRAGAETAPQNVDADTAGKKEPAAYNIAGTWEYEMINKDGNAYDGGTVQFEGGEAGGTYKLKNYYEVEYDGTYEVSGPQVGLSGQTEWRGEFLDANKMSGTWTNDETNGEWTANRI